MSRRSFSVPEELERLKLVSGATKNHRHAAHCIEYKETNLASGHDDPVLRNLLYDSVNRRVEVGAQSRFTVLYWTDGNCLSARYCVANLYEGRARRADMLTQEQSNFSRMIVTIEERAVIDESV